MRTTPRLARTGDGSTGGFSGKRALFDLCNSAGASTLPGFGQSSCDPLHRDRVLGAPRQDGVMIVVEGGEYGQGYGPRGVEIIPDIFG